MILSLNFLRMLNEFGSLLRVYVRPLTDAREDTPTKTSMWHCYRSSRPPSHTPPSPPPPAAARRVAVVCVVGLHLLTHCLPPFPHPPARCPPSQPPGAAASSSHFPSTRVVALAIAPAPRGMIIPPPPAALRTAAATADVHHLPCPNAWPSSSCATRRRAGNADRHPP